MENFLEFSNICTQSEKSKYLVTKHQRLSNFLSVLKMSSCFSFLIYKYNIQCLQELVVYSENNLSKAFKRHRPPVQEKLSAD